MDGVLDHTPLSEMAGPSIGLTAVGRVLGGIVRKAPNLGSQCLLCSRGEAVTAVNIECLGNLEKNRPELSLKSRAVLPVQGPPDSWPALVQPGYDCGRDQISHACRPPTGEEKD